MASYRFCRPDDVPWLVRAVNECWRPHVVGELEMTVERFRHEMKALDLWPSACMVASEGETPVAVLVGARREGEEVTVLRLATRPGHERRGHASHLVDSLARKLAVLGPPLFSAEVPETAAAAHALFEAAGFAETATLTDWRRDAAPVEAPPAELVTPIDVADLDAAGLLDATPAVAWSRRPASLRQDDTLRAWAVASPERVAAWAVCREGDGAVDVLALGCRPDERRELLDGLLLRRLAERGDALRLPRLADGEVPSELLAVWSFLPVAASRRYELAIDVR